MRPSPKQASSLLFDGQAGAARIARLATGRLNFTQRAQATTTSDSELIIATPDDWHLHVRDGPTMRSVVPHTAGELSMPFMAHSVFSALFYGSNIALDTSTTTSESKCIDASFDRPQSCRTQQIRCKQQPGVGIKPKNHASL